MGSHLELGGNDDTPTCVVDCGAADGFVGSETPPRGGAQPARLDPRTEPMQGGKPFLLPFAMERPDPGRPLWPQQPSTAAGAADAAAASTAEDDRPPPSNRDHEAEKQALLQQVQDMGFTHHQA